MKTEQYTRFILQQNLKHHRAQQRDAFAKEVLSGHVDTDAAKKNGKVSISKRRQKKQAKDESSDDENETALTRLTA
jgi:hypothetical protein